MFKRIIWMGTGVIVGAGGAFWAKGKVERTVEHYLPEQVATRAANSAKGFAGTVRDAASEGRSAMRETEAELRAKVESRTFVGDLPAPDPTPDPDASALRRQQRSSSQAGAGSAGRRRARR